jgi:hypothetical protein
MSQAILKMQLRMNRHPIFFWNGEFLVEGNAWKTTKRPNSRYMAPHMENVMPAGTNRLGYRSEICPVRYPLRPTAPAKLFTMTTIANATILVIFKILELEVIDMIEKITRCLIKITKIYAKRTGFLQFWVWEIKL